MGAAEEGSGFWYTEATIEEDGPGTFDNRRSILHQFLFRA